MDVIDVYMFIAAPFLDEGYFILRPGSERGVRIPAKYYQQLLYLSNRNEPLPDWLITAVDRAWSLRVERQPINRVVIVRQPSAYGYGRATWEINLGCNFDCEHCYLGAKRFEGMTWNQKVQMLTTLRDAGVIWLQVTGGEPMIDKHFLDSYRYAWDLGMMVAISSNASRLWKLAILELLSIRRPYHLTISVYGSSAATYDKLVGRPGAFDKFHRGVTAALEAGITMNLNLVITRTNAEDLDSMKAMAEGWGLPYHVFSNISPTIYGGRETLPSQSLTYLRARMPFKGCNAGHTFFHVDPFGKASICKIGRTPNIDLLDEGASGLTRLGAIADQLLARSGGCSGCTVQGSCGTCMPLVRLYRGAKSPMERYCQHRENGEVIINVADTSDSCSSTGSRAALTASCTAD